ncbi:TPA: hypothetical protein ACSP2Z_004485, partial [Aeromonas hydrophila]
VVLCTMNELLEKLAPANDAAPVPAGAARRYLTVSDVEKDPALAQTAEAQLTDAAIDFLKSRRKEKQPYLK